MLKAVAPWGAGTTKPLVVLLPASVIVCSISRPRWTLETVIPPPQNIWRLDLGK